MAITRKPAGPPKVTEPVRREIDDAAFERIAGGALDAPKASGASRAGQPREKGKGYAMGSKRQITHMITSTLLDEVDAVAEKTGEARATVINRWIREGLARDGAT